jgi:hypothetical protein
MFIAMMVVSMLVVPCQPAHDRCPEMRDAPGCARADDGDVGCFGLDESAWGPGRIEVGEPPLTVEPGCRELRPASAVAVNETWWLCLVAEY